jgi:hypothetical protein
MAQAGVLMWQYWHGPRCFVPRCFLPPKYDYHRPAPVAILPGGSQCDTPVCAPGQAADGSGGDAPAQPSLVLRSGSSSAFSRHGSSDSEKGASGTLAWLREACSTGLTGQCCVVLQSVELGSCSRLASYSACAALQTAAAASRAVREMQRRATPASSNASSVCRQWR